MTVRTFLGSDLRGLLILAGLLATAWHGAQPVRQRLHSRDWARQAAEQRRVAAEHDAH